MRSGGSAGAEHRAGGDSAAGNGARPDDAFRRGPALLAVLRGPEHVIESANPRFLAALGTPAVVGRPAREAIAGDHAQAVLAALDRVYATGEPAAVAGIHVLPAGAARGRELPLDFVFDAVIGADGSVAGVLAQGVEAAAVTTALERSRTQTRELEAQAEELRTQAAQMEELQVELEMGNEELRNANIELQERGAEAEAARADAEEARALLDAFFEASPVAAAFLDTDLRCRRLNPALAEIGGTEIADALGKEVGGVIPALAPRLEALARQVLASGAPARDVEVTADGRSGVAGDFLVDCFPVRIGRGQVVGVGVLAMDVTVQKAADELRRDEARVVETLHRIGKSLTSELDLQKIVQEVTDAATALTGAQFGAFFYNLIDEQGESYTLYTISGVPREKFSRFPMPRNTPVFAPTFHGTGVVRSDDITRDPRYGTMEPYHGMPKGHLPVCSYLAVPVISRGGEVLGGLFFGHELPGVFSERDERMVVGVAGWAAVAMDNSRLYEGESRARAEAERADRAKSDFLATMSHELRTPLNATIGYTDLLLQGIPQPIPPAAVRQVERIGIAARHLLGLIDEILTFSRLEAGEEVAEPEPVKLAAVLEEVQALTQPLAIAKGLRMTIDSPGAPLPFRSDARKIRQILVNLVANAIKFTEAGEVALTVRDEPGAVVLAVSDTGRGIAPEHQERIFEAFWQVERGATRRAEGTGLGLSVTRRLARILGGDVRVSSVPGQGSTFTVTLPREVPPAG